MERKRAIVQARKVDPTELPPHGADDAVRRNPFIGLKHGGAVTLEVLPKAIGTANSDRHGAEDGIAVTPRSGSGLPVLRLGMKHRLQYRFLIASCEIRNVDRQLPQGDELEPCLMRSPIESPRWQPTKARRSLATSCV